MRTTRDVLVIIGAATACACLFVALTGLLLIELIHPDTDTGPGISAVWEIVTGLFGVAVGIVIGRRLNHNGV